LSRDNFSAQLFFSFLVNFLYFLYFRSFGRLSRPNCQLSSAR